MLLSLLYLWNIPKKIPENAAEHSSILVHEHSLFLDWKVHLETLEWNENKPYYSLLQHVRIFIFYGLSFINHKSAGCVAHWSEWKGQWSKCNSNKNQGFNQDYLGGSAHGNGGNSCPPPLLTPILTWLLNRGIIVIILVCDKIFLTFLWIVFLLKLR